MLVPDTPTVQQLGCMPEAREGEVSLSTVAAGELDVHELLADALARLRARKTVENLVLLLSRSR